MKKQLLGLLLLVTVAVVVTACFHDLNPVAMISTSQRQGYPPLEITFDGSGSQGVESSIVSYRWDFDDGITAETATVVHTFEEKGRYNVVLIVTDADGLIGSVDKTIHVLNFVPHADFRIFPYGAPHDYPVQFDASKSYDPDGEIISYHWDFGDETSAKGMNVEHIFPEQQTKYQVTLTVIDDDGAANNSVRTVVVLGCDTCG